MNGGELVKSENNWRRNGWMDGRRRAEEHYLHLVSNSTFSISSSWRRLFMVTGDVHTLLSRRADVDERCFFACVCFLLFRCFGLIFCWWTDWIMQVGDMFESIELVVKCVSSGERRKERVQRAFVVAVLVVRSVLSLSTIDSAPIRLRRRSFFRPIEIRSTLVNVSSTCPCLLSVGLMYTRTDIHLSLPACGLSLAHFSRQEKEEEKKSPRDEHFFPFLSARERDEGQIEKRNSWTFSFVNQSSMFLLQRLSTRESDGEKRHDEVN